MKRQKIEMESKLKNRETRRDQWIKQAKLPKSDEFEIRVLQFIADK